MRAMSDNKTGDLEKNRGDKPFVKASYSFVNGNRLKCRKGSFIDHGPFAPFALHLKAALYLKVCSFFITQILDRVGERRWDEPRPWG